MENPKRKYEYQRNDASYTDKRMAEYLELKRKRDMLIGERKAGLRSILNKGKK